ncbi:floral homeotic protein GLOBOSA-like, partial [Camellia sinensis]|uniref:floral homeotic protein GLOBOSA-like n=1 Tax=Camellia sinensis TaxID=4442 RepID=UPI0010360761
IAIELDRIKKENDSMQIELRHLKGEDITSLHHKELMAIEEALENGLGSVREKQMEYIDMMEKNKKMLEEENKHLNFMLVCSLIFELTNIYLCISIHVAHKFLFTNMRIYVYILQRHDCPLIYTFFG